MTAGHFNYWMKPAIRVAAAGLGAAVAGPLGGAIGGWLAEALGGPAAELVETYADKLGEATAEKLLDIGADSLVEWIKDSPPDLESAYREGLRSSLARAHASGCEGFDDWFDNWDSCLASRAQLELPSIQPGQLVPEELDSLFRRTLENLDSQGLAIRQKSLSLRQESRVMPEALLGELKSRLPEYLDEEFRALIVKPEYEKGWKQAQLAFQRCVIATLKRIYDTTQRIDRNTAPLPQIAEDTAAIRKIVTGISAAAPAGRVYVSVPPLPENFVDRPDEQERLRQALIADTESRSIALTALEGMGGIGKTVLVQAVCHDEAVQRAFPDGIFWTTVGQESVDDARSGINKIRMALGDEPSAGESESACIERYRSLLRDKVALVVVNDVWKVADVAPFRAVSARSRLLFTTRDTTIAAALGAHKHIAGLLKREKAQEVLACYSWLAVEKQPIEAGGLIEQCGGLPLALAMVGAMLRDKPLSSWKYVLGLLQKADLQKIRAQFPDYPHKNLLKAIQVSVEALEPEQRRCYFALAVLLEEMAATPVIQQILWNAYEGDALETAEKFIDLSLAQREGDGIRLHDLQLDYVRAQYPDRKALGLIHGAMQLSAHVVAPYPYEFAGQMVGRLLPHQDVPAIQQFTAIVAKGAPTPWLRPIKPTLQPPGDVLNRTLEGHSAEVWGVAVSADGRRAVSASSDTTLKVWDVVRGQAIHTLEGHSGFVLGVAVSADGRRAVSASSDTTLKVWDVEIGGQAIQTLEGHFATVWGVAVSADGRRAVSASSDTTLKVWNVETGQAIRTIEGHFGLVRGVALSPDGRRAVSASNDKTLKVWDVETGQVIHTLEDYSRRWVLGVAVSADGRCAVSASDDRTLQVWDVVRGQAIHTLEGHRNAVKGVAVSADGRRAVSASDDRTLRVWDLKRAQEIAAFTCDGQALCCALVGDGTVIAGDALGHVHFLRLEEPNSK